MRGQRIDHGQGRLGALLDDQLADGAHRARPGRRRSSGIGKRAGTNWLPARSLVVSSRMLIGIVMRSASTSAGRSRSW